MKSDDPNFEKWAKDDLDDLEGDFSGNEDDSPDFQSVHKSSSEEELSSNEDVSVTAQSKPHILSSDDDEEPPITKRKKKLKARTSLNGRQMLQIKMITFKLHVIEYCGSTFEGTTSSDASKAAIIRNRVKKII
ncbi:hypothetical protein RN001_001624 [Aquatica leii]|uniref:Uncharacterized protein n=1 Tax=Aquatica leii TaxID=1421715 RepID=A0AAN7PGF9_9COLE|nr:hypothetical protein RN001_001624 [Aquatica leii]